MRQSVSAMLVAFQCVSALSHTSHTGYSGAPGSKGTCASSCHGSSGGTIKVTGFPSIYSAGKQYQITVSHLGGDPIRQFNGSCRTASGVNGGIVGAHTGTAVYNVSGETNGIHLSTSSVASGAFTWTAPASGTGTVKLYVAGLQGAKSGKNTSIVMTTTETTTSINLSHQLTIGTEDRYAPEMRYLDILGRAESATIYRLGDLTGHAPGFRIYRREAAANSGFMLLRK